jgi:hypothetical protein
MRASFEKWWLLPSGILIASLLAALSIIVFGPSLSGRSSAEVARRAAAESSKTASAGCSGASANDYACYQERYRDLVRAAGVEAAFAELKDEYEKNEFVRANCHPLVHVIGSVAAELYGDLPATYAQGDPLCGSGYYHGATASFVAKIGAERMLEAGDTLCAELGEHPKHSAYHRNCVHGLGHGFMVAQKNELFAALEACDTLSDSWEREHCYGGVFMENIMAEGDTVHPSRYLKADQLLYPCTDVETRYRDSCYLRQTAYALKMQDNDFSKVFDLCRGVEDDHRPACYQGLGRNAAVRSFRYSISDMAEINSTSVLCTLGKDYEARSNCIIGAVQSLINTYNSDAWAKALCDSFDSADLRSLCLQEAEKHYKTFDPD